MSTLTLILIASLSLVVITAITIFIVKGKGSLHKIYHQAVQYENAMEYQNAIELYELIVEESARKRIKDRGLAIKAEKRLKTLKEQIDFEITFTHRVHLPKDFPLN